MLRCLYKDNDVCICIFITGVIACITNIYYTALHIFYVTLLCESEFFVSSD